MKKHIFEILVSKDNKKGPEIFEHILVTLHEIFEEYNSKKQINFSFEITRIAGRIRFFIVSPIAYLDFLKNQIYAHFNDVEILDISDYFFKVPDDKILVGKITQTKDFLFPIKTFDNLEGEEKVDPYSSILAAMSKTGVYSINTIQINFRPVLDKTWKKNASKRFEILTSNYPEIFKKILLSEDKILEKILLYIFIIYPFLFLKFIFSFWTKKAEEIEKNLEEETETNDVEETSLKKDFGIEGNKIPKNILEKLKFRGYKTSINIISASENKLSSKAAIKEIASTFSVFSGVNTNKFKLDKITNSFEIVDEVKARLLGDNTFILNTKELSSLVHMPTDYVKIPGINWVTARKFEPPSNLPIIDPDLTDNYTPETDLTPIGKTNFRGTNMSFGIGPSDRRRHIYIIGKTGMGKSTLLENMIIDDIKKGRGVAVVDPHGDLAENILGHIPKSRTNHTIIFDPSDTDFPIAFNMLEKVKPEHRSLVASGLIGIFKKIFENSWGPRLEHILRNTILALLEYPNATLVSIPLMLTSDVFRNKVVNKITDPIVKKFWTHEFAKMAPNQKTEATGPILNKVGQFLSSTILRNILGQAKNTFDIRWAMDNKRIIIINLSKGKIGEDASALLGAMMVTKFQIDAMSRADIPEENRKDFYLYVDEFQNFATDSFATILSEARKYKLNLVMANQYIDQMQESVKGAVFGNVGTTISFQVGYHDANILKEVLGDEITENDLTNLAKYKIYTKLLIDGMPSSVFSADTFPPATKNPQIFETRYKKILQVSRERFSKPKDLVEARINKTMKEVEKAEKVWAEKIKKQKK